jgi:Xaa-Pro aminopeptidase
MLTKSGCLARRARLWKALPESVEWVLVADPRHVQYLANFQVQPLSFSGGERGLLLLERSGRATLLADNLAIRASAHEPFVDGEVVATWYDHRHSAINRDHALLDALGKVVPDLRGRRGLVEAEWLPLAAASVFAEKPGLSRETGFLGECYSLDESAHERSNGSGGIDVGSLLRHLRRQKELDEVDLIRLSVRAGEAGHVRLREILRPGISEREIYTAVQKAALDAAGRPGLVYGDFRATSAQQIKVGGLPTDHVLQKGELFILDYSVVFDGYRADFTNTLSVGPPTDQQMMLFELCIAGMRGGESALQAGAAAKDVHAAVMRPFRDAGYAAAFPHHAGHGIGLAHPEPPILVPESRDVLVAGDVVTLEPGAYVEGIGGMRIEHNYLITERGYERLTNHVISLT